jgi:serine/threonine protein kinase/Ca2+-binding EF-hand superfamily protein
MGCATSLLFGAVEEPPRPSSSSASPYHAHDHDETITHSSDIIPLCTFLEYQNLQYLSTGSIGTVYQASSSSSSQVALKFFGYTKQSPDLVSIHHELAFLHSLRGLDGIVELKGYFFDTSSGYLPKKKFSGEFPVFVMELLDGGEITQSIGQHRTEKFISSVFYDLLIALQGIHEKRFLHRDLKLENLMLISSSVMAPPHAPLRGCQSSHVKIIDFGSMVSLPPALPQRPSSTTSFPFSLLSLSNRSLDPPTSALSPDIYRGCGVVGSPGLIAPETILNYEYSFATDIWQVGCLLYSLLSGHHAFSPNRIDKIINASFFPLTSTEWSLISSEAKDLLSLILVKDPTHRLTIPQILAHPWMINAQQLTPTTTTTNIEQDLGEDYSSRIKSLTLSRKIRDVFMKQDNLLATRREKIECIQQLMPRAKFLNEIKSDLTVTSLVPSTPQASPPSQVTTLPLHLLPREEHQEGHEEDLSPRSSEMQSSSPRSHISIQQTIEERVFLLKKNIISYLQHTFTPHTGQGKGRNNSLDGITSTITPAVIYEEGDQQDTSEASQALIQHVDTVVSSDDDSEDDEHAFVTTISGLTLPSQGLLSSLEKSRADLLASFRSPPPHLTTSTQKTMSKYVDYSTYSTLLCESGLDSFATQEIFEIFERTSQPTAAGAISPLLHSKVDVMDVLMTFLVFYDDLTDYYSTCTSSSSSTPPHSGDGTNAPPVSDLPFDNSRLYFEMFDLNHTGVIDVKNLKIILRCLLLEEKYLSQYHQTILRSTPSSSQLLPSSASQHQLLSAKTSFKKKPSHIRHRSSSSEVSAFNLGGGGIRMLSQQSFRFQSFDTVHSMRSTDYDELFQILDEEKTGVITYEQFKDFYDTLYLQLDSSLPPSLIE